MKLLMRGSKNIFCRFISTSRVARSRKSCEIFDVMKAKEEEFDVSYEISSKFI